MCSRVATSACRVRLHVRCSSFTRLSSARLPVRTFSITRTSSEEPNGTFQPYFYTALSAYPNQVINYSTFGKARDPHLAHRDGDYLVVLLATPGSLDKAKGEEDLVQRLLQRYFREASNVKISVLVAYVDALPSPLKTLATIRTKAGLVTNLDNLQGNPGVSIALLQLNRAAPDIWSDTNLTRRLPDRDGAVPNLAFNLFGTCRYPTFVFPVRRPVLFMSISDGLPSSNPEPYTKPFPKLGWEVVKTSLLVGFLQLIGLTSMTVLHSIRVSTNYFISLPENDESRLHIQLPLANTLFYNGQPSTMYLRRWKCDSDSTGQVKFCPQDPKYLEVQAINIHKISDQALSQSTIKAYSKLRRITKPRAVAAARGNVIRALVDDSGAPQPASEELEEAIHVLSRQDLYANRAIEVWAIVSTKDNAGPVERGTRQRWPAFEVTDGTTLFKVLSGGGGWGEKRGLLSLGSTVDFQGESIVSGSREETREFEAYPNVVESGDLVTFAVIDAESLVFKEGPDGDLEAPVSSERRRLVDASLKFGCIPSLMDQMPNQSTRGSNARGEVSPILIRGLFGALSSRGIHVGTPPGRKNESGPSQIQRPFKTTIDAPYTTVSIFRKNEDKPSENDGESQGESIVPHRGRYRTQDHDVTRSHNEEPESAKDDCEAEGLNRGASREGLSPYLTQVDTTDIPEQTFKIRQYTTKARLPLKDVLRTAEFAALKSTTRQIDISRRKDYALALLQGIPAAEAMRIAGISDEEQWSSTPLPSFSIEKYKSRWAIKDASRRRTVTGPQEISTRSKARPRSLVKKHTAAERQDIQAKLKARSGYFFNKDSPNA